MKAYILDHAHEDVANKLIEEKRIVKGLLDAILEHIGASIEYERELSDDWL